MSKLIILGDKTANEVLEAAGAAYRERFNAVEKLYYDRASFVNEVVPAHAEQDVFFHAGIANFKLKCEVVDQCNSAGWRPFSVVHPTAVVAPSAKIGVGVFVGPLAVISSHAQIDDHSIVHIHASVGHDVSVGQYCSVLPGARVSGGAKIGDRSVIGSNAFVGAKVSVGADCRVDALAYVRSDLDDRHILSPRFDRPVRRVDM